MLKGLGFLNWILYIDLLTISLVISFYIYITHKQISDESSPRKKKIPYFILGDRIMHFFPISLSYFGVFFSSITVLGVPTEIYLNGVTFIFITIGYAISCLMAVIFYNPVFYHLRLLSVYEYIGLRFSKLHQVICAIIFIIQMLLYLGIVLYGPALAFSIGFYLNTFLVLYIYNIIVVDFNKWIIIVTIAIVSIAYTALGGFVAVIYTTYIQIILLFIGLIPIVLKGYEAAGGIQKILSSAKEDGRLNINWSFDFRQKCTLPGLIIGGTFLWMGMNCATQTTIQRVNACQSEKHSKIAIFINVILMKLLFYILVFCGLSISAHYKDDNERKSGKKTKSDVLLVEFVLEELKYYPGILGLFLVSVMSGSLSTISGGLNSLAVVTLRNIFPIINNDLNDESSTLYLRFCTVVYGIVIIWFAYLSSLSDNILQMAYSVLGLVSGPMLGVFTLGLFFPKCNYRGALIGHSVSQILLFWILIGKLTSGITYPSLKKNNDGNKTYIYNPRIILNRHNEPISGIEHVYAVSSYWYSLLGFLLSISIGSIASYITRNSSSNGSVQKQLITPLLRNLWKDVLIDDQSLDDSGNFKLSIQNQS